MNIGHMEVAMDDKTALITGASSGLGIAFARELAGRGYDLALTARSQAPMERLGDELRRAYGIKVPIFPFDLSEFGSPAKLAQRLDEQGIVPDVLVNNAGFGLSERLLDHDPKRLAAMLQLNVMSLTELSQILGRRMAERGHGHILMVASMAAFQPTPMMAAYGASKAYILSLGEALNLEFAPSVGVTVLSPGLMNTGFNAASGYETSSSMERFVLPTERVAKIGLDALFARRSSAVAGRLNGVMAFASRFVSRHAAAKQVYRMSGGK
jgi:short-subunit dehydrogenase